MNHTTLARKIAWRVLGVAVGLWIIVSISFFCFYAIPGDPARIILGPHATAEDIEQFRKSSGLDRPLLVQYGNYLTRLAGGDLGQSFSMRRPVADLVQERGAVSLRLLAGAVLLMVGIGLLLPPISHVYEFRAVNALMMPALDVIGLIPPFVLATVLLIVGAAWLGLAKVTFVPSSPIAWILPSIALAAYPVATVYRLFYSQLGEELAKPYAIRAKGMGFSRVRLVVYEALPNALPPILALIANHISFFVTGSLFVEVVFGIGGLGRLAQESLHNKDLQLLGGVCLLFAISSFLCTAALRSAHLWLDPRAGASDASS
jgi:ABC-type dipeptide/oligopeptide/nickel transport system permease component